MVELVYDELYEERRLQLLEVVEWLEQGVEPMAACDQASFEAGLSAHDLRRIIHLRDRFPHWRDERFVPPFFVQKAMLHDGRYDEAAKARAGCSPA